MLHTIFTCIAILCAHQHVCTAERSRDRMYVEIDGVSACFRRLNGTNQFGCTSAREGTTGVIHFVETQSDISFLFNQLANNDLRYVPAIPVSFFTRAFNERVHAAQHIAGVLVYEANESLSAYSHDETCPNAGSNIPGTCAAAWNPHGSGLLKTDITYPVFYLNTPEDIEKLRSCFKKFNNFSFDQHPQRALCAIEMNSFMFAAHDTPTCLRRSQSTVNFNPIKFCDPLGDQNVWASLFPVGNASSMGIHLPITLKHILIVTRMDATSFFHALDPGAQSSVTSLVTLLAVAELLKRMLPKYNAFERNVMFVVFNGEAYDYIGSQRFVYDLQKGAFPQRAFDDGDEQIRPMTLDDIDLVLELSQLSNGQLYLHHMANDTSKYYNLLNSTLKLSATPGDRLPPTSAQSFAREDNAPPLLVLTTYNTSFTNAFYDSIYDTAARLNYTHLNTTDTLPTHSIQVYLAGITTGIAKAIFQAVTNEKYEGSEEADVWRINELLHCYLENANCSIHRTVRRATFQNAPLDLYVGVTAQPNVLSNLVALTLVYLMGDVTLEACGAPLQSHVFYHFNMSENWSNANQTRCYRASMNLTDAESPAFSIPDYDWRSGRYSTWTESVWREFHVRLFLQPARAHEIMTVTVGAVVCTLAFCVILCINTKRQVLFSALPTTTPPTNC